MDVAFYFSQLTFADAGVSRRGLQIYRRSYCKAVSRQGAMAMNILHLDSSAQGAASVSRSLTAAVVAALRQGLSDARVRYRDLAVEPLPAVSGELLQILRPQPGQTPEVSPALRVEVDHAEALLAEFLAADTVVIGAPMYNFAVPSALKAWIDRVVLPGRTFSYTAAGPKGLAGGKRVIVASTRGSRLVGASYETLLD